MSPEFEAKFLLNVPKDIFRDKLMKCGAVLQQSERLMRRVLFGQESNPTLRCDYIRVRDEGDKITFSAKVHARTGGTIADNYEAITLVENFDGCISILEHAGLVKTNDQQTKRETWTLGEAYIEIDTWPGLDPYIEIESITEERVKNACDTLGLSWENKVITSVEELYMEKYNVKKEDVRKLIAFCTFEKHSFM